MGLRALILRLLGETVPPPPRINELAMRLADVEVAIDAINERIGDALRSVNARITNAMKSAANPPENGAESLQDASGRTIGPSGSIGIPPQRRVRRNY